MIISLQKHRVYILILEGFEMNHWLILVGLVFAAGLLSIIPPFGFPCDNNPLFLGRIQIILLEWQFRVSTHTDGIKAEINRRCAEVTIMGCLTETLCLVICSFH